MAASFKELTSFFREIGAADVGHTNKTYLAHCIGVYVRYEEVGRRRCDVPRRAFSLHIRHRAFPKIFALPVERRDQVRALIGERAEYLAYVNCAMVRDTFDAAVRAARCSLRAARPLDRQSHRDDRAGLQRP